MFVFLTVLLMTSNKTNTDNESPKLTQSTETKDNTAEKNEQKVEGYKLEIECVEETVLKISTDVFSADFVFTRRAPAIIIEMINIKTVPVNPVAKLMMLGTMVLISSLNINSNPLMLLEACSQTS